MSKVQDVFKVIRANYKRKEKEDVDPGFGLKAIGKNTRFLAKDGSTNIRREGLRFWEHWDVFHWLITMSWGKFVALILLGYFCINFSFALLYYSAGMDNMTGVQALTPTMRFWYAFFFSCQTVTTVGYGHIAPMGGLQNSIAAVESLLGLMGFAVITGLLYGRFSRAKSTLAYSENAVVAPYRGITALMMRVANPRQNELIELEAVVMLSFLMPDQQQRSFVFLELERKNIMFLSMSWTIVHPIDENSPLVGLTEKDFEERDLEWLVVIKGFDDSRAQHIYSRTSYKFNEVVWGAKFKPMDIRADATRRQIRFHIGKLGEWEKAELPY